MDGVRYMMDDAASVPMHFHFMAPSCVPATPWETSGAILGPEDVSSLLAMDEVKGLAEMMNFPGVLNQQPDVMAKLESAQRLGKPIDGHAPGLSGPALEDYIAAGISTDHECTTLEEALEKSEKGMTIQVREGTACKNMTDLIKVSEEYPFFLATDDMHASDLVQGYMNSLLRKAVSLGVDPVKALKAATIWPSRHYKLEGGNIDLAMPADLAVVKDLKDFEVLEVYIAGELVAKDGKALFTVSPQETQTSIWRKQWKAEDFLVGGQGEVAKARVIGIIPDQIVSEELHADLPVRDGRIRADTAADIMHLAVINRYQEAPPALGFIKGLGIDKGAIASSVAHDSHNIIIAATNPDLMARAANSISAHGGYYATDGQREASLPLPVAGLMSTASAPEVAAAEHRLQVFLQAMGCPLNAPFMTLGFQSLLVIPSLKMSDRGLFDSSRFQFVPLLLEQ
jgi:adenine deaminase